MPLRESDLDFNEAPSRRSRPPAAVALRGTVVKWFMGTCVEWSAKELRGLVRPGEINVPVLLRVGSQQREGTLQPAGPGRLRLILPSALLKKAGAQLGSELECHLQREPPRQPPSELPAPLQTALLARPGSLELFRAMSVSYQRAIVKMIDGFKSEAARRRGSEKIVERIHEMAAEKAARQAARAARPPRKQG